MSREKENFLQNVAWLRRHYGISKKRMAKLLHISLGSIDRMEKGDLPEEIDVSVLFYIQDYFGIPPQELLERRLTDKPL